MHLSWFSDDMGLPRRADLPEFDSARACAAKDLVAVAVQAADTVVEAEWLLARADREGVLRAVVLQYEPQPGRWAGTGQSFLEHAALRGIRLAVASDSTDLGDPQEVDALAAGLSEAGKVLEVLIRPAQLQAVADLAHRHPRLSVVVCHLGLGTHDIDQTWREGLALIGDAPGVSAKFSGLFRGEGDVERITEVTRRAFEKLGSSRLMFGSDWPMSTRGCDYSAIVNHTAQALARLPRSQIGASAQRAIWAETARRIYRL